RGERNDDSVRSTQSERWRGGRVGMNTGLKGRTVVVAGAGGGGIGTAICKALAEEGAVVAGLDRDAASLALSEQAITAAGGTYHSILLDLREAEQVEAAVEEAA